MADLKEITLEDIREAFNAGKPTLNYRGGGSIDVVKRFKNADEFLASNKKLKKHLAAEIKAAKAAAKK
jgi:hypothetical protein